ncbi:Arc family DNA binding domain-containing protein [Pedobacter sp. AW31-3R]|uniref:Arc family DNA binding domain-containing protein n=1 Tax=Pedobacter sp. AW31-3R TaxID=3445781 RepID=UPI003F9EEFDE
MSDKEKKAFVLRMNPQLLKDLEQWAADEFRSTNGQIEYLLHTAIKARKKSSSSKSVKKESDGQI